MLKNSVVRLIKTNRRLPKTVPESLPQKTIGQLSLPLLVDLIDETPLRNRVLALTNPPFLASLSWGHPVRI